MAETKLGQDAVTLPVGTTVQRPSNPEAGMIRFNTDTGQIEGYNDLIDEWQPINQPFQKLAATGGTVTDIIQDGLQYRVHTFTSDGTFEVTAGSGEVDYVIVGGGGGGGGDGRSGGGGGGGGVLFGTFIAVVGTYAAEVGDGGAISGRNEANTNGGNSSLFGVTALGGGHGATEGVDASVGASGGGGMARRFGGGAFNSFNAADGTSGQGNSGGATTGTDNPNGSGWGGGGGGAGESAQTNIAWDDRYDADGGDGIDLSGITSTALGDDGWFGGGGGGGQLAGRVSPLTVPQGGKGGGGHGGSRESNNESGTFVPAAAGEANTGGGGGGFGSGAAGGIGGPGGSGVVIVRYRIG